MTNIKTWTLPNRHTTPPRFLSVSSPTSPCLSPSTPRSHSRSPLKKTPSPTHKDVKQRSSTSLSLFGSFVRSLKIKNKKGRTSPSRSGLGIGPGFSTGRGFRRSLRLGRMQSMPGFNVSRGAAGTGQWEEIRLSPPQRERMRLIEERKTRWETMQGKGKAMDCDDGEDEDEGGLGPAQYLFTNRRRASLGSGASGNINPFKTPPVTPLATDATAGDDDVEMGGPPLSPMGNSPDSARSKRRRAERSRMKSLQILGPEACGVVAEKREQMAEQNWDV